MICICKEFHHLCTTGGCTLGRARVAVRGCDSCILPPARVARVSRSVVRCCRRADCCICSKRSLIWRDSSLRSRQLGKDFSLDAQRKQQQQQRQQAVSACTVRAGGCGYRNGCDDCNITPHLMDGYNNSNITPRMEGTCVRRMQKSQQ